jgi:hypothetical protein
MRTSNENDAIELTKYQAEKAKYEAEKAKYEAERAKYEVEKAKCEVEKAKYGFLKKPVALATNFLVQVLPLASELDLDKLVELLRAWFLG